jgi:hypothetical protein
VNGNPPDAHTPHRPRNTDHVGYSPYRKFRARTGDYVMVVAAALVGVALVAWAFLA